MIHNWGDIYCINYYDEQEHQNAYINSGENNFCSTEQYPGSDDNGDGSSILDGRGDGEGDGSGWEDEGNG